MIDSIRYLGICSPPSPLDNLRRGMVLICRLDIRKATNVTLDDKNLLILLQLEGLDIVHRTLGCHRLQQGPDGPVLVVHTASPAFRAAGPV